MAVFFAEIAVSGDLLRHLFVIGFRTMETKKRMTKHLISGIVFIINNVFEFRLFINSTL